MHLRAKILISVIALLAPVVLLFVRGRGSNFEPLIEPHFLWRNWLYMAAPQVLALAVAAIYAPSRRSFLVLALAASAVLVVLFKCWIWFSVPPGEGGLAWVLYIPLWATLLVVVAGVAVLPRRGQSEL